MATDLEQPLQPRPATHLGRFAERVSVRGVVSQLLPFALAFTVYLVVFLAMDPASTGDESHYLVTAESIGYDLDVDLRNDYASRRRVLRVVSVFPLEPHAFVYKDSGELRPLRGVGFPAVLAPATRLWGLNGARLTMILIAALLADQLYRLLRDLRFRRGYRELAWAAALFCMPVVTFSSQVYPELPGALLVVVALRVMVTGASRPAALALASASAAYLAWLHVRFLPLSLMIPVGLGIAAALHGWTRERRDDGLRGFVQAVRAFVVRCLTVLVRRWRTVTVPVVVPYVLGIAILSALYYRWYGSFNLQSPYRLYGNPSVGGAQWDFWYHFMLRDLLDPIVGWLPFAPVHWLGFAALGCLVVWFGWSAAGCVAAATLYLLVIESAGPGSGFQMPGRYPMILIPLIAVPLALVIQRFRVALLVFLPLFAVSLVFVKAAMPNYLLLYGAEHQRIYGVRSIASAFPNLNEYQWSTGFAMAPGDRAPQTGRLRRGEVVARADRDGPGYLIFGPYSTMKSGAYEATFSLAASGAPPDQPVAKIDVVSGPAILAEQLVTPGQLRRGQLSNVNVPFATPGNQLIETRVYYLDHGTLRMGPINVHPIVAATSPAHFRDWPLVFLWVGGTALVGWLFVQLMLVDRQRKNGRNPERSAAPGGSPS